ncbi:short-chain dehydrogenase/reductase SDR [Rhodomicrobium vannielii ATCC 17100]|uniref:Short-chain dehydrogenase/reductase SDR n=1 Tax=Rhodomicrobium vannielii (strain ATCC 17100 / DSM 162 / LMG 4299 / NCIMB 10020 / ATH 3.1.1) TaxID=648757 RepID=E3HZ59_RHOVT|nr:SDR family oxidoreductase [Rhodomicrobium vannielii]ADP72106.1 short-chain dehydrogenase/reductase SDR [Rhodomicrobium vannielii ATCC 17100]
MGLFDLSGRVAVITGSSRGIGRAIAREASRAGASVVVSSRKLDACQRVVDEIRESGGRATAVACNVGVKADLEALVAHALREYGRIDILIPNAAINPAYGPSSEVSDEVWNKVLTTNLTATNWLSQLVLPGMAENGGGSVILLSSIVATVGAANIGVYAISKAAEAQLARNLAVEWGPRGIRVNSIAPGVVKTDFAKALYENPKAAATVANMTCLKRLGEPEDIAGAAVFLASDAARYITGQFILVDGGASIFTPIG